MHQERARAARAIYAPEFNEINKQVGKRDSSKDPFNRTNLYIYIHVLTILVTAIAFYSFLNKEEKLMLMIN